MIKYLDCSCVAFPPSQDSQAIITEYFRTVEEGKEQGFTPVIVVVDDLLLQTMSEWIARETGGPDINGILKIRQTLLNCGLADPSELFEGDFSGFDFLPERRMQGDGPAVTEFSAFRDYAAGGIRETVLARIPTKNAWEIFAWVPMGGWNACPIPQEMMAAAKYWNMEYGAVPAVISHDMLDFYVEHPPDTMEQAKKLLKEHCVFCPDMADSLIAWDESAEAKEYAEDCMMDATAVLQDSLKKSSVWTFWWD